jgi:hypothetical protein
MTQSHTSLLLRSAAMLLAGTLPHALSAQSADRVITDTPSRSSATHIQHDSLTVQFLRAPKAKPAALSVGGKTAAQARKFDGKPEPVQPSAPVVTPLPTRARVTKP